MLLLQAILRAASRAAWTAGKSKPTKIPIIAMTTSNSTNVNALRLFRNASPTPRFEKVPSTFTTFILQRNVSFK
jgi:hypothetical protein